MPLYFPLGDFERLEDFPLAGLGERDLEACGEVLTLFFFGSGDGDLFPLTGERDTDFRAGDLDLGLRAGLRLSLNGDLLPRTGDLR